MAFFRLQQHDNVHFFKSIFYFSTRYDQFIKQYQLLILTTNTTCFACLELLSLWKSTTVSPTSHHFKLILNLGNVKF